jgi:hypothetical protein
MLLLGAVGQRSRYPPRWLGEAPQPFSENSIADEYVTQCSLTVRGQRVAGTRCLQLQGERLGLLFTQSVLVGLPTADGRE